MPAAVREKALTPSASQECYLRTIYEFSKDGKKAFSIDIAHALGYSRASVCEAVGKLRADGLVKFSPDKALVLTGKGIKAALDASAKYSLVKLYLLSVLGVDALTAEEDAVCIAHLLSCESAARLSSEMEKRISHSQKLNTLNAGKVPENEGRA